MPWTSLQINRPRSRRAHGNAWPCFTRRVSRPVDVAHGAHPAPGEVRIFQDDRYNFNTAAKIGFAHSGVDAGSHDETVRPCSV